MAWSLIFTYKGAGRMVVARDMFLKGLVFCGVVGLVPFFALEGVRCVRVLLGGLKK
ncbi:MULTISPECIES: hypothetical protein [unclassified Bartonella]|uniref:hypothetical protein n=1 Tax=unclassified Bartonella TaxID=2645622 RepID=UPI0035D083E8